MHRLDISVGRSLFHEIVHPFKFEEYERLIDIYKDTINAHGAEKTVRAIFEGRIELPKEEKQRDTKILMSQLFAKHILKDEQNRSSHALLLELNQRFPWLLCDSRMPSITFSCLRRLQLCDLNEIFLKKNINLHRYLNVPDGFIDFVDAFHREWPFEKLSEFSVVQVARYFDFVENQCPIYFPIFLRTLFLNDMFIDYTCSYFEKTVDFFQRYPELMDVVRQYLRYDPCLKVRLLQNKPQDIFSFFFFNPANEIIITYRQLPFFQLRTINLFCLEAAIKKANFDELISLLSLKDSANFFGYELIGDQAILLDPLGKIAVEFIKGVFTQNPAEISKSLAAINRHPSRFTSILDLLKHKRLILEFKTEFSDICCNFFEEFYDVYKGAFTDQQAEKILYALSPDKIYKIVYQNKDWVSFRELEQFKLHLKDLEKSRQLSESFVIHEATDSDLGAYFSVAKYLPLLVQTESKVKKVLLDHFFQLHEIQQVLVAPFLSVSQLCKCANLKSSLNWIRMLPLLRRDVQECLFSDPKGPLRKAIFYKTREIIEDSKLSKDETQKTFHKEVIRQALQHLVILKNLVLKTRCYEFSKDEVNNFIDECFSTLTQQIRILEETA